MKSIKLNKAGLLLGAFLLFAFCLQAQYSISGPSSTDIGDSENYTANGTSNLLGKNWSVNKSHTVVSGQGTSAAEIRINEIGNAIVNFSAVTPGTYNSVYISKNVTVNGTVVGPVTITPSLNERCQGGGTTNFNASASNATGYSWTIASAGTSTISSSGLVTWDPNFSNGTARITVTANGPNNSTSTAFRDVTVTPSINSSSLNLSASSTTVCSGQTETLSVFGASGNSYELLRNNVAVTSPINGSNTTITWTASSGGEYRVRASKLIGSCPPVLGSVVTLNAVQNVGTFQITGGTSLRCTGSGTSDFNASASNATNYVWSLSNAGSSSINTSSGMVTWHSGFSGTAIVSVTASNSCHSRTVTRNVTVSAPPNGSYTLSGTSALCSGSSGGITLSDSQSGVDYTLKRGTQTISTIAGTGSALTWSSSSITSGTYSVTASNGVCPAITLTSQWTIGSTTPNDIGISSSAGGFTDLCPGQIQLFPTNTNSVQSWSGVDSWTSTNATVNIAAGQSKTVTLYATNNCDVSQDITVTLTGSTGPSDVSIDSGDTQVCQGTSQSVYVGSANNASSHLWSIDPVAAGTIDQTGTVSWNNSYVGQATITYEAQNSCDQTNTADITVEVTSNALTFYEDKDHDGFYISSVQDCTNPDPAIYVTQEAITGSGDCDDNDAVLNPDTVWYEDANGDGLGDPNVTLVQCEQPTGYVLTPDANGPISEDPLPDLSGLDTQDMNTTFTVEPYTPTTSLSQIDALPADGKMASRTYYDGMGRPVQEVALHAGGISYDGYTGNDIVNYIEYDRFGRTVKRYSPYGKLDQVDSGDFEPEAKSEQIQFYATGNLQNSFVQTANPFSETVFDRSPRNRAIRQASPGDNWSIASGNEVSMGYFFNEQDEVRYFKVDLNNDLIPTLMVDGHYPANELVKTVVRDENWTSGVENTAEEFVNKDGQTVLKRTYVGGETLSTYYVYDDYGNLTYVLPPKTEPDTATITTTLLNSLAFQYRYDALRRQVEKRNPGVDGWERIVYDYEDRPILAQDANMALNDQWLFTKYDKFGRPVYTGFFSSTQTRAELQQLADNWVNVDQKPHNEERTGSTTTIDGSSINYSNVAFPDTNLQLLSVNYYDDYAIIDSDKPTTPTVVQGQNVTTNTKGLATISWVRVLDGQPDQWNKTYMFYDTRARVLRVHTKNYQQGYTIVDNELDFRGKVVNMVTQHQKDALDPLVSIKDSYTYDHMERIRTQSQKLYDGDVNGTPTEDKLVAGFLYDALGQLTKKYVEPESDGFGWQVGLDDTGNALETPNSNDPAMIVSRDFTLGEAGVYDVSYDFSGDTSGMAYSLVLAISRGSTLVYRENLTESELGNTINFVAAISGTYTVEMSFRSPNGTFSPNSNFAAERINLVPNTTLPEPAFGIAHHDVLALQMVDYQYNARGSMTQINDVDNLQNDLFAYSMHYDQPTAGSSAAPMYNGNIAQVQWKTQNDGVLRGYGYAYDALSRITNATDNTGNYNISNISYDKNGNLLTLNRKGWGIFNGSNAYGDIDMLDYSSYDGNKLLKVMDGGNTAEGFRYNSTASVDYGYDANGNMISDANKGITLIEYNHLDLPEKITFSNSDEIRYLYDAMGNKLKKTAFQGGNPTITEYWNGFQYLQGELQFFAQPEGYTAVGGSTGSRTFDYVYHYTDHLGNVRLSYSDIDGNGTIDASTEIINENNYYPFGMLHRGYNGGIHPLGTGYTYGFNGKELQEDNDITWLDFGSRNYDPALGRWMNIDPQSGRYMGVSPFAAMGNNPVTFVDPNGEELITTLIAGAVIGAWLGGATTAVMGGDIDDIGNSMLFGAISGLATAGIGQAFSGPNAILASNSSAQAFAQAGAHGVFQGSLSAVQGGDFGTAFVSGALSSGVASGLTDLGGFAQVGGAGLVGGISEEMAGGNFGSGFTRGVTVAALNHVMHRGAKGWLPNIDNGCCGYEEYFAAKANEAQSQIDRLNSGNSLRDDTKTFLGVAGRGLSAGSMGLSYHGRNISKIGELTIGSIGRWNVYSKSSLAISGKLSSYVRLFGRKAGALSLGFNVIDYSNGNTSGYDLGVNSGFTLYGMYGGPIGWFLSGSYFIFDITGGKAIMERRAQHMHNDIKKGMGPQEMMKKWSCFVKGTKVLMADLSEKNIETIKLGDIILSVNINTMKLEEDIVIEIPEIEKKYKIIRVEFSNGTINEFSPAHPYWVLGKGWSVYDLEEAKTELAFSVAQLEVGDTVLFYEKGKLKQTKILSLLDTKEFVEMYNVEHVKKNNTFFANKILVHNKRIN